MSCFWRGVGGIELESGELESVFPSVAKSAGLFLSYVSNTIQMQKQN